MPRRLCVIAAVLCLACSSSDAPEQADGHLTRVARVELEQTDRDVVASVADVLEWQGSLAVVDRLECNVKIFDPASGALLSVIGRRGQGPGEFLAPDAAVALSDGRLAVHDALLQRVSIFDAQGGFEATWPLVGHLSDGMALARNGNIVAAGRLLSESGLASEFELHEFTPEGELVRSSESIPEPQHFGERNFNVLLAAQTGDRRVTIRRTTNLVRETALTSGEERVAAIGASFYRPPTWDLEPGDTADDGLEWQRRQYLAWHLRGLDHESYVVGFVGPEASGDQSSWWVVVGADGTESLLKAGVDAGAGRAPRSLLALVDITDSGTAVATFYSLGGAGSNGAL